jgi:hypothetical protein
MIFHLVNRLLLLFFFILFFSLPTFSQDLPRKKSDLRDLVVQQKQKIDSLVFLNQFLEDSLKGLTKKNLLFLEKFNQLQNDQIRLLRESSIIHEKYSDIKNSMQLLRDSLNLVRQELEKVNSNVSINYSDSLILYETLATIKYGFDEQDEQISFTSYTPIGFSEDGRFFAYFSNFGDVAVFTTFEIIDISQHGTPKILVQLNFDEAAINSDSLFISPNTKESDLMIRSVLKSYGIIIKNDTALIGKIDFNKIFNLNLVLKNNYRGICYDSNSMLAEKRIVSAVLKLAKGNKTSLVHEFSFKDNCITSTRVLGFLKIPNSKKIICLIAAVNHYGFEGWREAGVEMIVLPIN